LTRLVDVGDRGCGHRESDGQPGRHQSTDVPTPSRRTLHVPRKAKFSAQRRGGAVVAA
jgi:hypothetical protein